MPFLSTYNWDTAFGIRFKDANAAIVKAGSSPGRFSGAHTVAGSTFQVSADFGAWQMTGGSGSLLIMTLPMANGSISGGGQSPANFTGTAQIQVSLGFVPQPDQTSTQELRLDTQEVASVLQVTLSSGPESATSSIRGALQDWLNANLGEFNHVFAAVDLNLTLDQDDVFAWVKPTHVGYAIYTGDIAAPDDYLFGVLAMTEKRHGVNLSPAIDPDVIPKGADAGFLISSSRVVEKMFLPQIETLFLNAKATDFDRQDDGMTIVNTKTVNFTKFTLSDGTEINDAHVDAAGFTLSVGAGHVEISFTGLSFTWQGKYNVTVNYSSTNSLGTDSNGHLQLTQTDAPTVSVVTAMTSPQKWKEIWESIGIGVGLAVVGAVIGAGAEAGVGLLAARRAIAAGTDAAESAGSNVVEIPMELVLNEMTPQEQVLEDMTALRSAVRALQAPAASQTFSSMFRSAAWKLLGLVIGAAIGAGISGIVTSLQAYAEGNKENMPTLDAFTGNATGNFKWASITGFTLKSAQLKGAIQLGLAKAN